jgi:hypothetical protein
MTRNDDFDPTLAAWLRREAPSQAPDRVLDGALQRVAALSQKRSWPQRLMGETPMTVLTRAAAVTAVVAVAALIGFQVSNLSGNFGDSPSPTASSSLSPTPTASLPAGCVNPPANINTLIEQQSDPAADPVACYGNAVLTFDATWIGGGVADCPGAPEPAWLACSSFSLQAAGDTRKVGAPKLFVAVEPSVRPSFSEPYPQVRVTGHFDDPGAQTCGEIEARGETMAPATDTIERCRRTFVVTGVAPLD